MTLGLNDYEFQLNDSGVRLNTTSAIPFVDINKVSGLDNAPYRETTRDHEGVDGGFLDAEFEKGRDIILEGVVFGDLTSVEPYLDSLKYNYAPVTSPIPFYYKSSGVTERVIFVKTRGVRFDWDSARRIGTTDIQFLMFAEDPRIYTNVLNNTNISYGGDAGLGLAFSFGFNINFGGGATPGGGTFTNDGNRSTPVVFTITGPVINPIIYNYTTGKTMSFIIELTGSDTLTINTNTRTVYLNGNSNRRNTMQTFDWIFFDPGSNLIGYGGSSGSGSVLNVQYRSAWR